MHTYTLTKAELIKAQRRLDELQTIKHEIKTLSTDFPILESLWNKANSYDDLKDIFKTTFELLNGSVDKVYDIHPHDILLYTYTDTKKNKFVERYNISTISYFRALVQVLAYKQYNIVDDLRRVQKQEHDDHIQYLLDIGCTEQELIRAGLMEICIPFSACPKRVTMGVYSGE